MVFRGADGPDVTGRWHQRASLVAVGLVVEGAQRPEATLPEASIADQVRLAEERLGLDRKAAMSYVAKERGIPRREVYAALLQK